MIKTLLAPYLGWIYLGVALSAVGCALWAYNIIYDRGYQAASTHYEQVMNEQKSANDRAIASAEKTMREDVEAIKLDKEKLENENARLNKEALEDPDARSCGIKRGGVQRINAVR